MAKVTLEQWRMLKAVVDHGGFAQAAEAVHKSQSSINHAIHKLEDLLGVKVLEVRGRKAELTEAGRLLLKKAEMLISAADNIQELAGSLASGKEMEVRLAVDQSFPLEHLINALARFSLAYPDTRVQLYEIVLSGAAEFLINRTADLVITNYSGSGFLGRSILDIEFVAVSHPDHPLQKLGRPLSMDDLKWQRQIVVRDSAERDRIDEGWLGAEERWTVANVRTSLEIIQKGFGYAWLPMPQVRESLDKGRLKALPLESGAVRRMDLKLYHTDLDRAGPATRYLAELLVMGDPD